ncbi:hypothetical protein HA402_014068 [Bradysia odoriphaga]|nr:hypothetical protein HA402_014068 [Bradysia odoriphaga]
MSPKLIEIVRKFCLQKSITTGKAKLLKAATKGDNCSCNKEQSFPCGPLSGCSLRAIQIECSNQCSPTCLNKSIQLSKFPRVTVEPAGKKGLGLFAEQNIEQNDVVIEYVGEIIDTIEYNRRRREGLLDYCLTYGKYYIDAYNRGNFSRFSNSSHRPNCKMFPIDAGDEIRLALVACKDIIKGEEIVWNYGKYYKGPCYCGETNCSGEIGIEIKHSKSS